MPRKHSSWGGQTSQWFLEKSESVTWLTQEMVEDSQDILRPSIARTKRLMKY